jgi:hypothetical protein
VRGPLRNGSGGRRGFARSRRPHAPRRFGQAGPSASAGRGRQEERRRSTGEAPDVPAGADDGVWSTAPEARPGPPGPGTLLDPAHRRDPRPGRGRRPVTGPAHRLRVGRRSERRTLRWGQPTPWGRSRRTHVARQGHASRTCRTGIRCAPLPAGARTQGCPRRGSACTRGTGGGKTARPGLHGGCRVTGMPTVATSARRIASCYNPVQKQRGVEQVERAI